MEQTQKQSPAQDKKYEERIVRILSEDIRGDMGLFVGLTKIKGVSWSLSNAVCKMLNLEKDKKVGSLTEAEVAKITEFIKKPNVPKFLLNRNFDFETGEDRHLVGTNLELQKEFDIKRLKKIKSYRGIRHSAGLPLRGQRTRSNFRKNKSKSVGIKKKSKTKKEKQE